MKQTQDLGALATLVMTAIGAGGTLSERTASPLLGNSFELSFSTRVKSIEEGVPVSGDDERLPTAASLLIGS